MSKSGDANASDQKKCLALAQNVIHGVMAGFTNFTVSRLNGKNCYLPLS